MKKAFVFILAFVVGIGFIFAGGQSDSGDSSSSSGAAMSASEYNEAPILAEMVKAGKLPPVEDRLPNEPLVLVPNDQIGKYGGTIRLTTMGSPSNYVINTYWLLETPIMRTQTADGLYANVLRDFKESADYKEFTFYLREGLKWSDGTPVTTEDVRFWYEDIFLNDDLMPSKPSHMKRGSVLMEMSFIDDYTFSIKFDTSFPSFIPIFFSAAYGFGGWGTGTPFVPKHFFSQFHITYNAKANDDAKAAGFDYWYQLMGSKNGSDQVDKPTLGPWVLSSITTDSAVFERNPYYFKVDPEGNQLPYVDSIEVRLMADREAYKMSVIGGETDYALTYLTVEDYPLMKENEARGGYTVNLWKKWSAGAVTYFFYQTYEDDAVRELLQDVRFRQAMSLAIDREEMNKLLYYDRGTPGQVAVPPGSKYHIPELWESYAEYDPDKANALLDEIGLEWDENNEFRVMENGKPVFLKIEGFSAPETPTIGSAKLVKDYWEAVGVKTDFDFSDTGRFITRFRANQVSVATHWVEMLPDLIFKGAVWHSHEWWCKPWWDAFVAGGGPAAMEAGAPQDLVDFFNLIEDFNNAMTEDEKVTIVEKISTIWVNNLWGVGTIGGDVPSPQITKNYLKNILTDGYSTWFMGFQQQSNPSQYYLDK